MIKHIIDLLQLVDWEVLDEDVKIAKGKYKLPENWKEFKQILKQH